MAVVACDAIRAGFKGHQLLLLLHPAVHAVAGDLGAPPPQRLRRPLGGPRAVWAMGVALCLPGSLVSTARPQQRAQAEAGLSRGPPAQGQVHSLLLELALVDAAGPAAALLPVPGQLAAVAAVDTEVVMKKQGEVTRVLQNRQKLKKKIVLALSV